MLLLLTANLDSLDDHVEEGLVADARNISVLLGNLVDASGVELCEVKIVPDAVASGKHFVKNRTVSLTGVPLLAGWIGDRTVGGDLFFYLAEELLDDLRVREDKEVGWELVLRVVLVLARLGFVGLDALGKLGLLMVEIEISVAFD